ncbi:zinc ribbon domain-containing protein [Acidipila sp. EB88]|uniref:double zinc ribbon domain-containing protein n=1 Tax=Acidipila sp. EB88 TaxID=2305226 RepID=UPI000F5EE63F|nr:zinc ribbon domain-containing protein [Acidipila sp. EB88]RRA48587.1 zinc ribbon domain-containing protein [Acidipila sp. EB88]
MSTPSTNRVRTTLETQFPTLTSELQLIPRWSVAAASLAFVTMLYTFWVIVPEHRHHQLPFGLRLYFALSWSALSALYMLMVGYVCRDTKRRGMRARLWIIVCLVLPGGIGSVLYFLLRQPLITLCPACGSRVQMEYHFCPQCAYQISASCARCYNTMSVTDRFCITCGQDRSHEVLPQRLYAFPEEV